MIVTKRHGTQECFVSDLNWHVLDPFGKKFFGHEKVDELIGDGAKFAVRFKVDGEDNIGVSGTAELDAYKGCKFFSVAALVALDKEFNGSTAIFLLENPDAEDGSGFAIGLISGNVVLDLSFKPDEIENVFSKFEEICIRINSEFILAGDVAPFGREIQSPCCLSHIVGKKNAKKIAFAELKNDRSLIFFGIALGIMVLILLANGVWGYYQKTEADLIRQVEAMKSTPEYVYGEAAKKYIHEDFVVASDALSTIGATVGSIPISIDGWALVSLKCNLDACQSNWKSIGGTYERFQQAAPGDWKNFRYADGGKDALGDLKSLYCDIPAVQPRSKLPLASLWPTAEEFTLEMGKIWQSKAASGFTGTLKVSELKGVPPGLSVTTLSLVPGAVHAMPWEFRDQEWKVAKEVIQAYPENVTITEFSVRIDTTNKKVLLSASGDGYVRK